MDPITAALNLVDSLIRLQTAWFMALPDAQRQLAAVDFQTFGFGLQQFAHDIYPKFPAPPQLAGAKP